MEWKVHPINGFDETNEYFCLINICYTNVFTPNR